MAYSLPELSDLLGALKEAEENGKHSTETLFSSIERKCVCFIFHFDVWDLNGFERSVLDFNDEAIDDYIDFCQRILLPREQRGMSKDPVPEFNY